MYTISISELVAKGSVPEPRPWAQAARLLLSHGAMDINSQGLQICAKVASSPSASEPQQKAIVAIATKVGVSIVD
tara:strand:- start:83 stop:307 length:225 start_codon:yes stop_codon:yes gene_type:complete